MFKQFKFDCMYFQFHIDSGKCKPPDSIKSAIIQLHSVDESISKYNILRIEHESSKLYHSRGDNKTAVDLLTSSIVGYVCSDLGSSPRLRSQVEQCKELSSRSVLTLVKWLQVS